MMPLVINLHVCRASGRRVRLWIPLLPVLVLLSPLLLLAALVAGVASLFGQVWLALVLSAAGRLLWAAPGTEIEIQQGPSVVLMSIR